MKNLGGLRILCVAALALIIHAGTGAAASCRSALRNHTDPDARYANLGFRLLMVS